MMINKLINIHGLDLQLVMIILQQQYYSYEREKQRKPSMTFSWRQFVILDIENFVGCTL